MLQVQSLLGLAAANSIAALITRIDDGSQERRGLEGPIGGRASLVIMFAFDDARDGAESALLNDGLSVKVEAFSVCSPGLLEGVFRNLAKGASVRTSN